jgi:hypothetical protein
LAIPGDQARSDRLFAAIGANAQTAMKHAGRFVIDDGGGESGVIPQAIDGPSGQCFDRILGAGQAIDSIADVRLAQFSRLEN